MPSVLTPEQQKTKLNQGKLTDYIVAAHFRFYVFPLFHLYTCHLHHHYFCCPVCSRFMVYSELCGQESRKACLTSIYYCELYSCTVFPWLIAHLTAHYYLGTSDIISEVSWNSNAPSYSSTPGFLESVQECTFHVKKIHKNVYSYFPWSKSW